MFLADDGNCGLDLRLGERIKRVWRWGCAGNMLSYLLETFEHHDGQLD